MRRIPSVLATALIAAIVAGLTVLGPGPPASAAPADLCATQLRALAEFNAEVDAHNARPHTFELPRQAAALAAYNREAARLNARKAAVISDARRCLDVMQELAETERSTLALEPPSTRTRTAIDTARKAIPPGWKPPAPPPTGVNWTVPKTSPLRSLYDELRKATPGFVGAVTFQERPRPALDAPDPAYPGRTIGMDRAGTRTNLEPQPDHIIPVAELVNRPDFLRLSAENMYLVTRAPINYQWLGARSNMSKRSRSVASMDDVDPVWKAQQLALEQRVRARLTEIIHTLLDLQA